MKKKIPNGIRPGKRRGRIGTPAGQPEHDLGIRTAVTGKAVGKQVGPAGVRIGMMEGPTRNWIGRPAGRIERKNGAKDGQGGKRGGRKRGPEENKNGSRGETNEWYGETQSERG